MSKPKLPQKPRLGRGLNSLISISKLPVEAEISEQPPPAAAGDANMRSSENAPDEPAREVWSIENPVDEV
jgi:hypothetical protein